MFSLMRMNEIPAIAEEITNFQSRLEAANKSTIIKLHAMKMATIII
jgi:hypothetical protein